MMNDDDVTDDAGLSQGTGVAVPTPRMLSWARNSAAYRLARRMMTRQELSQAVSRKARQKYEDIEPETVEFLAQEAVRFGIFMGAIDDGAYAGIKSQSASRSGKSRRAIAQTLARKGVDKELVTAALEEVDDLAAAVRFARKRGYGPFRRKEADPRQVSRELASLARQGFGFTLAQRVVAMGYGRGRRYTVVAILIVWLLLCGAFITGFLNIETTMYLNCDAPRLFDDHVAHHAVCFRVEDYTPQAAEQVGVLVPDTMHKAVAKRKAEYVAGRLCAMRAVEEQTGQAGVIVSAGSKGEPVWPQGYVGSITHTHGFAAAAVADARFVRGLGIDTEQIMTAKVMDNVTPRICRPEETYCPDWPISPEIYTTLVFSAKESLFKCLHPLVDKMFWFEDARIDITDFKAGLFTAILMTDLTDEFCNAVELNGRFRLTSGLVHTGISLTSAAQTA